MWTVQHFVTNVFKPDTGYTMSKSRSFCSFAERDPAMSVDLKHQFRSKQLQISRSGERA